MRTLSFFAENIREAKHGRGGLSISDSRAGVLLHPAANRRRVEEHFSSGTCQ